MKIWRNRLVHTRIIPSFRRSMSSDEGVDAHVCDTTWKRTPMITYWGKMAEWVRLVLSFVRMMIHVDDSCSYLMHFSEKKLTTVSDILNLYFKARIIYFKNRKQGVGFLGKYRNIIHRVFFYTCIHLPCVDE